MENLNFRPSSFTLHPAILSRWQPREKPKSGEQLRAVRSRSSCIPLTYFSGAYRNDALEEMTFTLELMQSMEDTAWRNVGNFLMWGIYIPKAPLNVTSF
jgi:hypothetical protein